MKYPELPKERIFLSETGERLSRACVSKKSDFKFLAIDLCASRRPTPKGVELPRVRDADSVAQIVRELVPPLAGAIQESFGVICIDTRNQVVGFAVPFTGGAASAPVEIATALKVPLLVPTCVGVIIFHNHPSGEPSPSQDDIRLTQRFKEACELVGLVLLDHVIIAGLRFYSFRDQGVVLR